MANVGDAISNATRSKYVISIFLSGFLSLAVVLTPPALPAVGLPRCRGNQEQAPLKTTATAQQQFPGVVSTHWYQPKCYNESSTQPSKRLVFPSHRILSDHLQQEAKAEAKSGTCELGEGDLMRAAGIPGSQQ